MDISVEALTASQKDILQQFRQRVKDLLRPEHDDIFLIRWLKARAFDQDKAEQMLKTSLEWRKAFGADTLLDWEPPEVLKLYWPGGIHGYDKLGHPVYYQLCKNFDFKNMMKCVRKIDVVKFHIQRMEIMNKMMEESSKKLGRRVTSSLHISDLDGFSVSMMFAPGIPETLKETFAIIEANYPENLYQSYVINAPRIMPIIFKFLRPFISEDTKRKVFILGGNWQNKINDIIEPHQLPEAYGGKAVESGVTLCRPIPSQYFLSEKLLPAKSKITPTTVPSRSKFQLNYPVERAGIIIRWVFETEVHDISFGVKYQQRADSPAEDTEWPVPVAKVDCHLIPVCGDITCAKAGLYTVVFDNSSSVLTPKKLYHEVELHELDTTDYYSNVAPDLNFDEYVGTRL